MSKLTVKLKRPSTTPSEPVSPQKPNEPSYSDDELLVDNAALFEDEEPSLLPCEWGDVCEEAFWDVESLNAHIHQHVDANPRSCQWKDCKYKGKAQSNKSTLLAHMRSHSGERAHWCKLPECDKVFSRGDALAKHERSQHADVLSSLQNNSKIISGPAAAASSRKRRTSPGLADASMGAGDSDLSDMDEPSAKRAKEEDATYNPETGASAAAAAAAGATGGLVAPIPAEAQAAEDEAALEQEMDEIIAGHPDDDPDEVRYIVMLARHEHIREEQTSLRAELEELRRTQSKLASSKDRLLDQICQKELESDWQAALGKSEPPPLKWSFAARSTLSR